MIVNKLWQLSAAQPTLLNRGHRDQRAFGCDYTVAIFIQRQNARLPRMPRTLL